MVRISKQAAARIGGILAGAGVLFVGGVVIASAPAFADNGPHVTGFGTTDLGSGPAGCAGCHRLHSSQGGEYLLTQSNAETLCLSCHEAGLGATTDVKDGIAYSAKTGGTPVADSALRGGGFENAKIGATQATRAYSTSGTGRTDKLFNNIPVGPTEAVSSTHALGGAAVNPLVNVTMWGQGGTVSPTANFGKAGVSLECSSCHDPHGNGNYRILRPYGNLGANTSQVGSTSSVKSYTVSGATGAWTATITTGSSTAVADHGLKVGQKISITGVGGNGNTAMNAPVATVVTVPSTSTLTVAYTSATVPLDCTTGCGGTITSVPLVNSIATAIDDYASAKDGTCTPLTDPTAATPVVSGCKSFYTVTTSQKHNLQIGEMVSLSGLTDLFGTGKPASGAIAATNVIAVPTTSAFKIAGQAYFAGPTYTTSAAALPTTGINLGFSSSITAASATGSLVTYTTAQSNGLAVGQKVTVAGAIPSTYNIKLGIISAIPTVGCTAATGVSNALCTQFTVDFSLSAAGLATAPTADYVGSGYVSGIPDVSTYSTSTGDKDAASAARYVYTQTNYWRADDHNYPGQDTTNAGLGTVKAGTSAFIANTGQWCTTCHTRYLASGSSSRKYSSGDAVFTYRHTSVATKEDSPSCMQCHVAHGSNAAMGVDANGGNAAVNTPNNLAFNAANPAAPTGSQPAPISTSTSSKLLRADNRGVCALCHDGQS